MEPALQFADQLATTVHKINTARLRLIEARQLRDGKNS